MLHRRPTCVLQHHRGSKPRCSSWLAQQLLSLTSFDRGRSNAHAHHCPQDIASPMMVEQAVCGTPMGTLAADLTLRQPGFEADLVNFDEPIEHPLDVGLPFAYQGSLYLLTARRHIWKCSQRVILLLFCAVQRRLILSCVSGASFTKHIHAALNRHSLPRSGVGIMAASDRRTLQRHCPWQATGGGHAWSSALDLPRSTGVTGSSARGATHLMPEYTPQKQSLPCWPCSSPTLTHHAIPNVQQSTLLSAAGKDGFRCMTAMPVQIYLLWFDMEAETTLRLVQQQKELPPYMKLHPWKHTAVRE